MELKKLIKSTSFLVISKAIQFVIGILRSKLGAIYIGTTGIGVFSQVSYLVNMISNLTLLSMNDGLVKQISHDKDEVGFTDKLKSLLKTYATLIIIASFVSIIICLVFAKPLTLFFLGDERFLLYYLYGITCVPITIANSLSFGILKSYKATKYIARSNITSAFVTILLYVPLIYFFRITGAVISVVVNYLTLLIVNNIQARKHILAKIGIKYSEVISSRINRIQTKELLLFAIFGATSGLILLISESICRSIVVNKLGIDKMGIYSPITSWGNLLTGFVLPALSTYLYPRFSECKNNNEISEVLNASIRMISLLMIPLLFIAIPFREIVIPIFYSKEFIDAKHYLPWHFIGVLFYLWWYSLALVFTPTGRIKIYSVFIILMATTNLLVVYTFVPHLGLYGWMLKFIVSPFLFYYIFHYYLFKKIEFHLSNQNLWLMIFTISGSMSLLIFDANSFRYFLSIILITLSLLLLTPEEKRYILKKFTFLKKSDK